MKLYIAEDEPLAAAKLKLFLGKLGEDDICVFDNGISLLAAIKSDFEAGTLPSAMFIDVQMPGMTGMQVLDNLKNSSINGIQVVVTSAYDQYALESFGYNVTDYLLKPYSLDRLRQALDKVKNNIRLNALDNQSNKDVITIRSDGKNVIVPVLDIICLEALKDYVRLYTIDGQKRLVLGTLSSFEEKLPADFIRVHRSYIINISHITDFNNQSVTLHNGMAIAVGKTYREQIDKLLNKK